MAALPSEKRFKGILPQKGSDGLPGRTIGEFDRFAKNLNPALLRNGCSADLLINYYCKGFGPKNQ
jgi:hypothetical protein